MQEYVRIFSRFHVLPGRRNRPGCTFFSLAARPAILFIKPRVYYLKSLRQVSSPGSSELQLVLVVSISEGYRHRCPGQGWAGEDWKNHHQLLVSLHKVWEVAYKYREMFGIWTLYFL